MKATAEISRELQRIYGELFFELRPLDRGCHDFCIVWSSDGGFTRLAIDVSKDNMTRVLAVLPASAVLRWIRACLEEEAEFAEA